MSLPAILEGPSVTRLLQGACAGALATVLVGFGWGGWMLGSTAKQMAVKDTSTALVAVLAPMCADKFRAAPRPRELGRVQESQHVAARHLPSEGRLGHVSGPDVARSRHRNGKDIDHAAVRLGTSGRLRGAAVDAGRSDGGRDPGRAGGRLREPPKKPGGHQRRWSYFRARS